MDESNRFSRTVAARTLGHQPQTKTNIKQTHLALNNLAVTPRKTHTGSGNPKNSRKVTAFGSTVDLSKDRNTRRSPSDEANRNRNKSDNDNNRLPLKPRVGIQLRCFYQ